MGLFNEQGTDRHCIGCEHFAEWRGGGAVILCMHEGRPYVQAMPARGCVHWVRAIGADDEHQPMRRAHTPLYKQK